MEQMFQLGKSWRKFSLRNSFYAHGMFHGSLKNIATRLCLSRVERVTNCVLSYFMRITHTHTLNRIHYVFDKQL